MCHHNSFLLYFSMAKPSLERWDRVTHISLSASLGIILLFAIGGYATFRGFTQGKGRKFTACGQVL